MNSTYNLPARKYLLLGLAAVIVAAVVVIALVALRFNIPSPKQETGSTSSTIASTAKSYHLTESTRQQIVQFCGACHVLPAAEHFPKAAWHHEVQRGFQFYTDSGRTDLDPPPQQAVVAYYQTTAPDKLIIPPVVSSSKPSPVKFRIAKFPQGDDPATPQRSTISAVNWLHRGAGQTGELFCSDMRRGEILKLELGREALQAKLFAKVPHPVAVRVCDLDGDKQTELVVADLGSFLPTDHELGAVWWFPTGEGEPKGVPILIGVGRVADVQPVDVDGDGDQDVLVAEFGWHKTGGIHLLENVKFEGAKAIFRKRILDPRPGTIHLPIADLNNDRRPDFVALISQEHESVVGCMNFLQDGLVQFQPTVFDQPQDPSIGSSGLSLVDLDRDGDLDVLVTNGDSFDSFYIKPAHGIQWMENQGDLKFVRHHITPMPGAHRALAGDLDGDGDVDIVAAAFLPKELRTQQPETEFDSLILLEQTEPGKFERHRLEAGQCHHTAMELADFDSDGDLDLAVSNFTELQEDNLPPLAVWWNLRTDQPLP